MTRLSKFAEGLNVLDLSLFLPGPLAGLLLADMGANVLKIEPPSGDPMAGLGPRDQKGGAAFYESVNAGKTVQRADLKDADVQRAFVEMVRTADILIEGFRPGVMKRLGLDFKAMSEINPRLIYCSLSGWGEGGPNEQLAGHDGNYLAAAGIIHRNGGDRPCVYDPPIADATASLFAVIAILGAVNARRIDGKGCHIDLALADVAMPLQLFQIAGLGATGTVPQTANSYLNGGAAFYQVYGTKDGRHVMLGAVEAKFWRSFCLAAGHKEWVDRQGEPMPQNGLIDEVAAFIRTLTIEECISLFVPADCCLTPVLDLGEAIGSPHHASRGIVRRTNDGDLQALFPVRIDQISPLSRPRLVRIAETDPAFAFPSSEKR
jgi:crotonobetainyl-CoA:carnitine CoA-transferase CaiB-like acyl-CoA transferase